MTTHLNDVDLCGAELLNYKPHIYREPPIYTPADDNHRLIQILSGAPGTPGLFYGMEITPVTGEWVPVMTPNVQRHHVFETLLAPPPADTDPVSVKLTVSTSADFSSPVLAADTAISGTEWTYNTDTTNEAFPATGLLYSVVSTLPSTTNVTFYDSLLVIEEEVLHYYKFEFFKGVARELYWTKVGRLVH